MVYTKITYKEIVETYYQTHYNSAFSLLEGENAPKLSKQIKKGLTAFSKYACDDNGWDIIN